MTTSSTRTDPASALPFDLTAPASYRCWVDEHVRFNDLDPVGHANNNAIGVYFESGRLGMHAAMAPQVNLAGHAVVLRQISIDFLAEITFPNRLRIGSRAIRVGRTSWITGAGLFIDDRCHATSTCVSVLINTASRSAVPLPDALRAVLAADIATPSEVA